MKTFSHYLIEQAATDISHWKETQHSQMGSNPGGIHHDSEGNKHYVKFPSDPNQARTEVATNKIFHHMGIKVPPATLINKGGRIGVSTPWQELHDIHPSEFKNTSKEDAGEVGKMYHASVLTKNWDVVGLNPYNIMRDKNRKLVSIDHGAGFEHRARGKIKGYDSGVGEIQSLRNPQEPSGQVFNHVFKQHPTVEKESLETVRNINPEHIHKILKDTGHDNHRELADTFEKRRQGLLKHYG